jgi:hypothetical protein
MKLLILLFLFFSTNVYSCSGYVIGFKGLNGVFDTKSFNEYVKTTNYCSKVYNWNQEKEALKFINYLQTPYKLYGFSRGAASVFTIMNQLNSKKPEYIITVGAYRTTDVNFDKFQVEYKNYFDNSGRGQKSPGIFLDVSHADIQREVNRFYQ